MWCSHSEYSSISRTSTMLSCCSSNTAPATTSSTDIVEPLVSHLSASSTRPGVSRRPSRSTFSPPPSINSPPNPPPPHPAGGPGGGHEPDLKAVTEARPKGTAPLPRLLPSPGGGLTSALAADASSSSVGSVRCSVRSGCRRHNTKAPRRHQERSSFGFDPPLALAQ